MIRSLVIKNYALIDNLNINLENGLTIITGETGAGKSIILGALSLIMGQRADSSVIKDLEKKCLVEVFFDVSEYNLKELFEKHDIDYFQSSIIRREISPEGRSRAFINDSPVNLSVLKEISSKLIDIHSQHDTLELNSSAFQLEAIDLYVKNQKLLDEYSIDFKKYKTALKDFKELNENSMKNKADLEYIQFQFNQISEAKLVVGEQDNLETEQKQLAHTEEIKQNIARINLLLHTEDDSIVPKLKETKKFADDILSFLPKASEISERIETALIDLQDLSVDTEVIENDLDIDPERLTFINERLDTIYNLQHKFNVDSIEKLLSLMDEFDEQLLQINSYDEQIKQKQQYISVLENNINDLANKLHQNRIKNKTGFENKITDLVNNLGMPNGKFIVSVEQTDEFLSTGKDVIVFHFSANKNTSEQEITKIASGGELSRLMLAIKYVISESKTLPTIIFDEIDTGISGEIADKMGILLRQMAKNMQIVNITHLPQIAAKANSHYMVYKNDKDGKTSSHIKQLTNQERTMEIAQMLSGSNITENAIQNAKDLLNF
ncbi:MAG: DNA repair protein RecN [Bacteroidota bacterium]|nr:DNA repair protein RecN [Bacteroidota bacterium]